jgi:hypothetical protein
MSQLRSFYSLLAEIQKLSAWVLPTAGITPVVAALAGFAPPWPNAAAVTVLTSGAVLFALAVVFQTLRGRRKSSVTKTLLLCAAAVALLGIAYFALHSLLVYTTPTTKESFVSGFECTADAQKVLTKCPWLDIDALKSAEYEATRLWTAPSIALARVVLLASWIGLFACYSIGLGAFVTYQSKTPRAKKRRDLPTHAQAQ